MEVLFSGSGVLVDIHDATQPTGTDERAHCQPQVVASEHHQSPISGGMVNHIDDVTLAHRSIKQSAHIESDFCGRRVTFLR